MATILPKVDPRVKRTRQLLQRAFLELLEERGFRAITVQDIAERATVNRATFYAHFEDKYALMDSFIREQFQGVLGGALSTDAAFTLDHLQVLARVVCEYLAEMQDFQCRPGDHAQFEPLAETAVQEELHAFIAAWLKQLPPATTPPRLTTSTAASVMSWAIFGAGIRWSRGSRELSADALAWQVVSALADGVPRALGVAERLA
jgi:AcrR family transcriptional regulator